MINVHHSTFDMNHQVINPKESTKVHLRNFTPPLHGLCFIPPLDQFCILKCVGWQHQNTIVYTSMNV